MFHSQMEFGNIDNGQSLLGTSSDPRVDHPMMTKFPRKASLEEEEMMGSTSTLLEMIQRRTIASASSDLVAAMSRVPTRRRRTATSSSTLVLARVTRWRRRVFGTSSADHQ